MIAPATRENIAHAAELIRSGEVLGFPTETVYGLGADASNERAVQKIFTLKQRPVFNPLIVHLPSAEDLPLVANVAAGSVITKQVQALSSFWPGPLTLVLPKQTGIAASVTAGLDTVAIRVPSHPIAQEFLRACKVPVAAPSANVSSTLSPTTALHVQESFGDALPFILDGGPCQIGLESTVLGFRDGKIKILRPGGITYEQLTELLGSDIVIPPRNGLLEHAAHPESAPTSPGQLEVHYAPRTPLALIDEFDLRSLPARTAYISFGRNPGLSFDFLVKKSLSKDGNLREVAAKLFATLRELDSQNLDLILVDSCEEKGIGVAIMDRLRRASAKH